VNPRRLKLIAILAGIGLSALTLLSWTQVWFTVRLETGQTLSVTGDVAAPALTALALSGLALAGALAIAGVVFRVILGVLQVAIGGLIIMSASIALADPIAASARAITAATGVSGDESVAALVSAVHLTAWPLLALLFGILLALLGVLIVVTARMWPVSSRKYQAVRLEEADGEHTSAGDWDALSDGRDPT
jgi:hypothetical protein